MAYKEQPTSTQVYGFPFSVGSVQENWKHTSPLTVSDAAFAGSIDRAVNNFSSISSDSHFATINDSIGNRENITKGKIYPLDSEEVPPYEFFFNPAEIEVDKSPELAKHDVPGYSLPAYQWMAGGEKTIKFKLEINRRYCPKDKQDMRLYDVNILEAYTYSNTFQSDISLIKPPRLLLSLGYWVSTVAIKKMGYKFNFFRSDLVPTAGEIDIEFVVWANENVDRRTVQNSERALKMAARGMDNI